jgi:hypothetical protein
MKVPKEIASVSIKKNHFFNEVFPFVKGAVDRGMHCIYKHDLPRINKEIKPCLSTHKTATRLNDRSCDVIRMAINQHILALLGM